MVSHGSVLWNTLMIDWCLMPTSAVFQLYRSVGILQYIDACLYIL